MSDNSDPKPGGPELSADEQAIIFGQDAPTEDEAFTAHMESQIGRENYRTGMAGLNSLRAGTVLSAIKASGVDPHSLGDEEGERLVVRIGQEAQKGFQEADRVTGHESTGEALAKIKVLMARPEYLTSKSGDKIWEDVRLLHRLAFKD